MKKYISYFLCFMVAFSIASLGAKAISADGQCVPISGTIVSNYDGLQCTSDSSTVVVTPQKLTGNRGICCAGSNFSQDTTIGFNNIYTNESGTVTIRFDTVSSNTTTTTNNSSSDTNADAFELCDNTANPGIMAAFKLGSIILLIVKIIIPIILIVLGMIDMSKAVISDNQDSIKKNALIFARRLATGILVFLTPTILLALFNFVDSWNSVESTYKPCIDCLLDTSKCPKDAKLINTGSSPSSRDSSSSSDSTPSSGGGSTTQTDSNGVVHGGSSGGF